MKILAIMILTAVVGVALGAAIVERTIKYVDENQEAFDETMVVAMAGMEVSDAERYLRKQIAWNRALATSTIVEIDATDRIVKELVERIMELESEVERLKGKRS